MSAARVYLMADFGKGPHAVMWWKPGLGAWTLEDADCEYERRYGVNESERLMRRPRWLVEADSADAARQAIAISQCAGNTIGASPGEILASGGRS